MAELVCAVDVGTTSARAGIFDRAGMLHGRAQHPLIVHRPGPGRAEHDSEDVWRAVCASVRGALAAANAKGEAIGGLAFGATSSLVIRGAEGAQLAVSDGGEARFDTLMWMDHRALAEADAMTAIGGPVVDASGGSMWPEMQAPKLAWLKRQNPAAWSRMQYALDLSDFLVWRSTGVVCRSRCNLAAKWPWSPSGGWDLDFLAAAGLEDLPGKAGGPTDAVAQGVTTARLSHAGASALGLAAGTPVAPGMVDAYAAAIAVFAGLDPASTRDRAAVVAGTSTGIVASPAEPRFVRGIWGPFDGVVIPGLVTCDGGQSASGALLDHIVQTFGARHATLPDIHERIAARIAERRLNQPDLAPSIHVLPDIHGNRSPTGDARARAVVSGIGLDNGFDALCEIYFRAAVGVALGVRQTIAHLNENGYSISSLHLTGGLVRNPLMSGLYADATQLPVIETVSDDPVLLGGAMAAAAASAGAPLADCGGAMRQPERVRQPDRSLAAQFDRDYRILLRMQDHRRELAGL